MTVVWFWRGDIRFWIDESALEQWDAAKRRTPGGQRRFSELAISTTLMLGVVFRLPLRQTEGFVRSLVDLMGCDLPVPDHTTLSRRRRTVDVVVETSTNKRSTDIVLDSTGHVLDADRKTGGQALRPHHRRLDKRRRRDRDGQDQQRTAVQ